MSIVVDMAGLNIDLPRSQIAEPYIIMAQCRDEAILLHTVSTKYFNFLIYVLLCGTIVRFNLHLI